MSQYKYLDNKEVIRWCYEGVTEYTLALGTDRHRLAVANKEERRWGNEIMGTIDGNQWTTLLCQDMVKEALTAMGRKNVRPAMPVRSSIREKTYRPDLVCDEYVYEVKGRSWTVTGTAGEKILGVPIKYGEVPRLFDKPLQIILVAYQEYEARKAWGFGDLLNNAEQTEALRDVLHYHSKHNIEYIGFTDILKGINRDENYWR